ncbi:MAG: hypothetical protein K1X74_13410 [Pirellulales bacterium]|nr:hypothetical protein [Pirellulales bacterium]
MGGSIVSLSVKVAMHTADTDLWQLPARLRTLVEAELGDGEQITWVGVPRPWLFALYSMPIVIFAIPWTIGSIFWVVAASGFEIPDFDQGWDLFPLWGIPFVLTGFGMLSSPYWLMRKAKNTVYVLTTTRAIIFDGGLSTTIRSFGPERLTDLRRKQRADGSGDLIFERRLSYDSDGDRRSMDHGFLAISDVKAVEDRVHRLVETSAKKPV